MPVQWTSTDLLYVHREKPCESSESNWNNFALLANENGNVSRVELCVRACVHVLEFSQIPSYTSHAACTFYFLLTSALLLFIDMWKKINVTSKPIKWKYNTLNTSLRSIRRSNAQFQFSACYRQNMLRSHKYSFTYDTRISLCFHIWTTIIMIVNNNNGATIRS